jgi:hypothetical protein
MGASAPVRRIPQAVLAEINRSLAGAGPAAPGLSDVQLPTLSPRQLPPQAPAVEGARPPTPAAAPAGAAPKGALAEAFYDPLGSWDNGRFGGPIGHHSDHVHLSITNPQTMLAAIRQAQAMGLNVGENPYVGGVAPVHVHGSFHYQDFPGRYGGKTLGKAIDVSGNPQAMAAFYKWATSNLR